MLIRMCWSSRNSGSEIMGFSCKEKGTGLEVTGWGQAGEGCQPRGGECWREQACACWYEARLSAFHAQRAGRPQMLHTQPGDGGINFLSCPLPITLHPRPQGRARPHTYCTFPGSLALPRPPQGPGRQAKGNRTRNQV